MNRVSEREVHRMSDMHDVDNICVCHACIGDRFLANEVKASGSRMPCGYCDATQEAIALDDLAARVHGALQEHFELTPDNPYDDEIFGDLTAHRTRQDRPLIREIVPDSEDRFIWRARVAQSTEEIETILKSPVREMGPPPPKLATSGRMNAQGISVFYGAMDKSTCIAEIRPPVGSHVVLARFEFLRPVRLLDLDALAEVYVDPSYFDPEYKPQKDRASFLKHLAREISRPVAPQDEALQYLTTQVVAEYLANMEKPRLDGIIFGSSQTGGNGRNLALFNHACRVEPYDLPEESDVKVYASPFDDEDESILLYETVPSEKTEQSPQVKTDGRPVDLRRLMLEPDEASYGLDPTLRLDIESIEVQDIKAVEYRTRCRSVIRHRETQEEVDRWAENLPWS